MADNASQKSKCLILPPPAISGESGAAHCLDFRIAAAIRLMVSHYGSPLSLADLACEAGLSVSRFARLFRQQTGVSPGRMLAFIRADRALELLVNTSTPLKEVAMAVGVANPTTFGRSFRSRTGRAPGAVRGAQRAARILQEMVLGAGGSDMDNRT